MCSILGGTSFDAKAFDVYSKAKDRGRDFSGLCEQHGLWIANHRATPTTEAEAPIHNQPIGGRYKIVHNGTISNDGELGVQAGEIDSSVLEDVLDCSTLETFRDSFTKIKGSYAIAVLKDDTIYLACNYKPIFILKQGNQRYFSSLKHHLGEDALRMPPYTVMNLLTGESLELPREQPDRAIVICSGGLDSTAVAGYAAKMHKEVLLIHYTYGCKAETAEMKAIKAIAERLKCQYTFMSLPYQGMTGGSPLLEDKEVAEGIAGAEYAFEWVPARNFLFLAYTTAYAEANGYGHIYLGTNLEEGGAYPDNEEQFILDVNNCLYGAVQNGKKIEIHTPLGNLMKREIVEFGMKHDAPLDLSWSCYHGGDKHCGKCAPCFMRKTAFKRAGIPDPTQYEE